MSAAGPAPTPAATLGGALMRSALLSTLALAFAASGCVEEHPLVNDLMSFEVTFAASRPDQPTGAPGAPLAYVAGTSCAPSCADGQVCVGGQCAWEVLLDVQAIGRDGHPFPYRGPVHVRTTPGIVVGATDVMMMDGGRLEGVAVHIAQGLGPTHVWFEADGFQPKGQDYGQCNDGIDNDGNGLIDLADPGCSGADDDLEAPVTLSTGVSPTLFFDDPTVRDVQFTSLLSTSPLVGRQVRVSKGTLVVTNVVSNGFYVADLRDNTPERLFNAMFVFTFSKPEGVDYGDHLCGFSGAVQEHVGQTQVVFPSYELYYPSNPACEDFDGLDPKAKVPDPWPVTELLLPEDPTSGNYLTNVYANSRLLEAYEGNLVTYSDVEVSTRFIACDKNGNGRIDSGTPEFACRKACQEEPLCSDLEGYFEYAQYAGMTGGKKKIYGSLVLADKFKPLDIGFIGAEDAGGRCTLETTEEGFLQYLCPPVTLESLTGSLRHIYLCGAGSDESRCNLQFWVLDPRFDGDVKVAE